MVTNKKLHKIRLVKAGTIQTAEEKELFVTSSWAKYFVGGSTDLWSNTFSKTDIENSGFGVVITPVGITSSSGQNTITAHHDLQCTNYGFDLETNPNIKGITMEIEAKSTGSGDGDESIDVRYVKLWIHTLEGAGTNGDPYLIKNWWHLDMIRDDLDAHYKLTNNLDSSIDGYEDVGDDWEPIQNFEGELDGDGHTISDLIVDYSYTGVSNLGAGLIGSTNHSAGSVVIKNIGLISVDIASTVANSSTTNAAGTILGINNGTTSMTNCFVRSGSVGISGSNDSGVNNAGGLIGWNRGTLTVDKCYSVLDSITSSNSDTYGTADTYGLVNTGTVSNSFWNTTTSGITSGGTGTGKTTAEMKDIDTYTDTATTGLDEAWDMVATSSHNTQTWFLGSDMGFELYPQLSFERKFLYGNALVDGFESGSYTDGDPITWTQTGGALTVSSTTPINGTYSLRETSPANDTRSIEYDTDITITDNVILGATFKGGSGSGAWGFRIEYTFDDASTVFFRFETANRDGNLFGTYYTLTTDNDYTRIEFENSGNNIRAKTYNISGSLLDVSDWVTRTSNNVTKVKIIRTQPSAPPSGTYYIDNVIYGHNASRKGFVWDTQTRALPTGSPEDSLYTNVITASETIENGEYFHDLSGLTPNTQYFYRAYAYDVSSNTYYWGDEVTFTTQSDAITIKVWDGSVWADKPIKYWNGTEWVSPSSVKVWNGTSWVIQ